MHHIAIMKKSWNMTEKIISGEKVVESRWYKSRYAPWDRIQKGDKIYFKDSGEPVTACAIVDKVEQYSELYDEKRKKILAAHDPKYLGAEGIMDEVLQYTEAKNYAIIIYLKDAKRILKPFEIDKSGFGAMASWICVEDVEEVRIK
jgi:ASC-1-like (ASCH) protein